jgi:tripartite-type tricarboxylate transporter receptor subunit TctC
MAPPGTPAAIVKVLNAAVEKAVSDPGVQAALKKSGLTPMSETPAQAKEFVLSSVKEVDYDETIMPLVGN